MKYLKHKYTVSYSNLLHILAKWLCISEGDVSQLHVHGNYMCVCVFKEREVFCLPSLLPSCCLASTCNGWCSSSHLGPWNDLKYGNHMAGTDRKNLGQHSLSRAETLIYYLQLCACLVEKINFCLSHYYLISKLILQISYSDFSNLLSPLSMIWRYNKGNGGG